MARTLGEEGLEAPEGVRDMIRRRIGALGPEDQLTLQHGSVMGPDFLSTVLAGVMGVDEMALEERLQRLGRLHRLIATIGEEELPDGSLATRYRFVHALDRETLYDDLVSKRRIAIHRRVGEELQRHYGSQAPSILAARLAVHFEQGRDFGAAVTYSTHAGDNAARLFAHGEAEEHYERAIRLAERLPLADKCERLLGLHQRRGAVNLGVGRFGEAAESYGRMLEGARAAARPELLGTALGGLCNALFFSHRIEEMAIHAEEALRAADEADSPGLRLEAMLLVAQILQESGALGECRSLLDEVVALARSQRAHPTLLVALTFRGSLHYLQSEYSQAEKTLSEAFGLASEQRNGLMVLACLMFLGLARGNLGRMSEALATLLEAVETSRRNGDHFWLPVLTSHVGWVHRELQDFDHAVEHDQRALRIARADRAQQAEASALINLSMDYTRGGRLDEASPILRDLEAVHSQAVWFGWLYDVRLQSALAEHWLAREETPRAEEHARRLLDLAEGHQAWTYAVTARRVLAEAALGRGDSGDAAAHLAAALDALRAHPAPLESWKVHATIGRVRSAFGAAAEASQAFHEAWLLAQDLAASVGDAALRSTFFGSAAVREIAEKARAAEPS
jgi:tetratricopeptide (TPR) repeat protein